MSYALLVKQPNGNSLLIKQAEASYFAALKARLAKADDRLAQAATILETLIGKSFTLSEKAISEDAKKDASSAC